MSVLTAVDKTPSRWMRLKALPGQVLGMLFMLLMNALEAVIDPLQRLIGVKRMGYFFVLPNMVIFGIFVLFPMALNFYYSGTGGTELYPQDRPWVGTDNFERLFNCDDFREPNSCEEDLFWRAIFNSWF